MRRCSKYSKLILCLALLLNIHCDCDILGEGEGITVDVQTAYLSIWEDSIVWHAITDKGDDDIYIYNILTEEKRRITLGEEDLYEESNPKVFRDYVVCLELPKGADDSIIPTSVVLYNVNTSERRVIFEESEIYKYTNEEPDIYGDWVVWRRTNLNPYLSLPDGIMLYNIKDGTLLNLTEGEEKGRHLSPSIFESTVCWINGGIDEDSISCYYIDKQTKKTFNFDGISPWELDVYKNLIAFSAYREGKKNIYVYDTATNALNQISFVQDDMELAEKPKIYGNIVVWQRGPAGVGNIDMFNLSTYEAETIPPQEEQSSPWCPDIWGNYIVWAEHDIYVYNISTAEITKVRD